MTSSDRTALGDRMKGYEAVTRTILPRRTYSIIRADIRAGHSYLRGCAKPFDFEFMGHLDQVAAALCAEVSGTVFAYVQSDEISLLVCDFESPGTQPWFGGEVQKIVSIAVRHSVSDRRRGRGPVVPTDAVGWSGWSAAAQRRCSARATRCRWNGKTANATAPASKAPSPKPPTW